MTTGQVLLFNPANRIKADDRLRTLLLIREWRRLLGYLPDSDRGFKGFRDSHGRLVVERWISVTGAANAVHDGTVTFDALAQTATVERDHFTVTVPLKVVTSHRDNVVGLLRNFGFRIEGRTGAFNFTGKVA